MKKIVFSIIIVVSFFFIVEGIARIFYKPSQYRKEIEKKYSSEDSNDFYMRHKTLGWILRPGYDDYPEVFKEVGKLEHFSINSQGLRDKEYPFKKGEDVVRIFCCGDSIAMGSGKNNDEAYPKALERYLGKKFENSNYKYEVINGGIGDYNAAQEYGLLKEIGLKYSPDIVIVGYYPNDGRIYIPPKSIFLESGLDTIYSKSAFVYFLNRGIRRFMISMMKNQWEKGRERWQPVYAQEKWLTDKSETDTLIALADKDMGVAWRDVGWKETETQLNNFLRLSKEKGFKLVLVYLPVTFQVYGAGSNKYDILKPEKDVRQYCLKNNIPFIALTDYLKAFKRNKIFIDYCHYTAQGAEVVGKYIGESLIREGVLDKK